MNERIKGNLYHIYIENGNISSLSYALQILHGLNTIQTKMSLNQKPVNIMMNCIGTIFDDLLL